MRVAFAICCAALLIPSAVDAKKRTHVVVQKPYPPYVSTQPVPPPFAVATLVVPPLLIFYDWQRRTNCFYPDPDPLHLGGPGFSSPITPASGNVMIPVCQRGVARPK